MRCERVPQQMRMDSFGIEAGGLGEPSQDQERTRARQRAALRVQEQFRTVALVEVGPAAREVTAERLDCLAADRNDALFRALAGAADEAAFEIDRRALEADRFAHAKTAAVEEL